MLEQKDRVAGVERLEDNKAKITITIDPKTFEDGIKKAYNAQKGKFDIPGFRKGKVPRKLIEAQYGKEIFYEEAINQLLPEAYESAVENHELDVVSRPDIEVLEANPETGAVVSATVILKPKASIKNYKGIEYTPASTEVTEEDIARITDSERRKNARFVPVEDRPVEIGDITRIDFEGFLDGVPFPGGKGEDHELVIGSGAFIPGFEDQIVGMKVSEEREINVTFPEEYHAEDLKGKAVVFKIKLNSCNITELPDLDDEFAQSVSDFDTLEEYMKDLKAALTTEKETAARHSKEDALTAELAKIVEVDVPDVMYDTETNLMIDRFARGLRAQGIPFEQYLAYVGETIDSIRKTYREAAERNVRARLALEAIAAAEGIAASEEEIDQELTSMVQGTDIDLSNLKANMSLSELRGLSMDIRNQKAMKLVMESAVVRD